MLPAWRSLISVWLLRSFSDAVLRFATFGNKLIGTLPVSGLQAMTSVTDFVIYDTKLRGRLPEVGLRAMTALRAFDATFNSFKGTLPDVGIRAMTAVTDFIIFRNKFAGTLPNGGIQTMTDMRVFGISENKFMGTLPYGGMSEVTDFSISGNKFTGMLPIGGLQAMTAVARFVINLNKFTDMLPAAGIQVMASVTEFTIFKNKLTGTFPDSGVQAMKALTRFRINENLFEETLSDSIQVMTAVTQFSISDNKFTGALPDSGIQAMMAVRWFAMHSNNFEGMLPDSGIQAMTAVTAFTLHQNKLTGTVPNAGMQVMTVVEHFKIQQNKFTGAFPDDGIQAMTSLQVFIICQNKFAGTLPASGIQATSGFFIQENKFAGVLPSPHWSIPTASAGAGKFAVSKNHFEGAIPMSLSSEKLDALVVGENDLEGAIPQSVCVGQRPLAYLDAHGLLLAGTIPASITRMKSLSNMALGHGLRGLLPDLTATFKLLSLWENELSGQLPELHITTSSRLYVHGNAFSCTLPRNWRVKNLQSLALIGNHFAASRHLPPWISAAEQPSDIFCLSNAPGKSLVRLFLGAACLFALARSRWATKAVSHATSSNEALQTLGRSAWYEASQQQQLFGLTSIAILALYNNMDALTCTVASNRLRFHFDATTRRTTQVSLMMFCLHSWIYRSVAGWHHRHKGLLKNGVLHSPLTSKTASAQHESVSHVGPLLVASMVHSLWLVVCVLTSVPGILYSTIHAVPNFLSMSPAMKWIVNAAVAMCSGLVTGLGLPFLAKLLWTASAQKVDRGQLLLTAKLLADPLLPCLVTVLCHLKCLGGWTRFWATCNGSGFQTVCRTANGVMHVDINVLSSSTLCGLRWHMDWRECMDSAVERLSWLLYPKCIQYSFTVSAFRMLKVQLGGQGMTFTDASVLLSYTWLLVTLFGPYLPLVNALLALLVKIHFGLLFDSALDFLDMDG